MKNKAITVMLIVTVLNSNGLAAPPEENLSGDLATKQTARETIQLNTGFEPGSLEYVVKIMPTTWRADELSAVTPEEVKGIDFVIPYKMKAPQHIFVDLASSVKNHR